MYIFPIKITVIIFKSVWAYEHIKYLIVCGGQKCDKLGNMLKTGITAIEPI